MDQIITRLNGYVWSWPLVGLCLIAALYFSIGTRFVQIRHFGEMVRLLFNKERVRNVANPQNIDHNTKKLQKAQSEKEGISSFQAFALALSGRVGTGNIVGVALAIGFGGPGSIVWMWIIAFFGAGTAYAEATLAQIFKERHGDQLRGGPAYYIEHGLHCRWLAATFAVIAVVACAIFIPPIHSNSIAMSFAATFQIAPWIVGIIVAAIIAIIVLGGVNRISAIAEVVTPFMAIAYVILSIIVLIANAPAVPGALKEMISSAFGTNEMLGGIIGSAIAWGVKRGIFSNEAGMGSAPVVAAAAKVSHPVKQGLVQGFSVYVDTLLVCTATALMLLATKCYNIIDPSTGGYLVQSSVAELGQPGVEYTIATLGTLMGQKWGGIAICITLFFFAFTTIMAFYYYAETNLVYLFSKRCKDKGDHERDKREKLIIGVLRVLFIGSVLFGSFKEAKIIWNLGDMGVGLMAWINLIAILLLSPKVFPTLRDYEKQQKSGKSPVFDPKEQGIEEAKFWEERIQNN